jgi:hypothetical protein
MTRSFSVFVVTTLAAISSAHAVETVQWYGTAHLAIESIGKSAEWVIDGNRQKGNRLGAKGGADTSFYDFRAIYQVEMGFDAGAYTSSNPNASGASYQVSPFYLRDTWVGIDSRSMGRVRVGTISTRYKETGNMVDLFWNMPGEGRGVLGVMSNLHNGTGDSGMEGRLTNSFRYDVPTFYSAFSASIMYHLRQQAENDYGLSLQYHLEPVDVFVEHMNIGADNGGHALDATKVGARAQLGDGFLGMQLEYDGGALSQYQGSAHSAFVNGGYKIFNTLIGASFGWKSDSGNASDNGKDDSRLGFVLSAVQQLAKNTSGYVQWGIAMPEQDPDIRFAAFGLKHDF